MKEGVEILTKHLRRKLLCPGINAAKMTSHNLQSQLDDDTYLNCANCMV